MIGREKLDALVVSTPDHTHAVATAAGLAPWAARLLRKTTNTHSIRVPAPITELARRKKLITQMGTQIHAGDNYRRVVELLRADAIGTVREVHVWSAETLVAAHEELKSTKFQPTSIMISGWGRPVITFRITRHIIRSTGANGGTSPGARSPT
ncbi:MAG: hypothetical protein CM1200mP29_05620 [Verrucomicrobiota bacterium]|nr:MAG: hypothetical protein CM1200mP29_05620 [Verrucomicrobiota bacterium]